MPVKDPIVSSPLRCEAARRLLMSMFSKTVPDGVAAIGSQSRRALLRYGGGVMRNP